MKRKERDEEGTVGPEYHGSTLFVSNLPFSATSTDLQTLFSEIAPVRNAFVVCEQGTGVSKGVGYISFSIREDAQTALDQITKEGLLLIGRKLRVQWAEKKGTKKEKADDQNEPSQKKPRQQPQVSKLQDPLAIRTIIISGLPPSIDSKLLWKKIRKCNGADKLEWPVSGDDGVQDPSSAYAVFSTPALALDAVNKLHAHVFKGALLSVTLKKRIETLSSQKTSTKAPSHANRLIVRNLPFTATEQDLRSIFLPYGPIYSINVPFKASPNSNGSKEAIKTEEEQAQSNTVLKLNKGFAFIWFYSRKDAEKAMEGINGTVVHAGAAEELVKGKQKKKKERRLERKLAATQKEQEATVKRDGEDDAEGDENGEGEDETHKSERVVAVDWALSKDRWEEEKAKMEEELQSEGEEGGSDPESEGEEESDEEDSGLGVHDEPINEESSNASGSGESEDERGEDDKPVKPQLPQTDVGTTLFIRNVSYDATEDELRTLFRAFGSLRYARITMDPATGRSRGTGFACFWNKEDADKVIQQSELLRSETTGNEASKKKNPFTLPSILAPDPSSSLAQNLVLHGRALDVIRAVTRDEAGRLKEIGERAREKADKRNMYLLREGVILPNSLLAGTTSPADLERRTNSFNARRALLKSNPSLYISKTRLSIRQIPLFVTEQVLKRLAIYAVRAFEKEVKAGKRDGLTDEESRDPGGRPGESDTARDTARNGPSEADNESDASSVVSSLSTNTTKSAKRKAKFLQKLARTQRKGASISGVKQAKIVRQAERVDAITGKGRSRGYGFVEMYTHADALRVLRWANANTEVDALLRLWWSEELERLIKVERDRLKGEQKDEEEKSDARLKRMVAELAKEGKRKEDDEARGRGTLIVEFSIENVQVVQRRKAVQKNREAVSESSSPHPKKHPRPQDEKSTRPSKKRRTKV